MEFVVLIVLLAAAGYLGVAGLHTVPAGEVGIVVKKSGRRTEGDDDAAVSVGGGKGVQARTLRANTRTWLVPFVHEVRTVPRIDVPDGMVGIVKAKVGRNRRVKGSLAKHVECDDFRDGVKFLAGGGERGPQQQILISGTYEINTEMFDVVTVPRIHVPDGTIGVVKARVGGIRPPGSQLPKHVECDFFRDGVSFLAGGGEQGPQQQVLTGGHYDINTEMFEVITVETPEAAEREGLDLADLRNVELEVAETGVVVTHVGVEGPGNRSSVAPPVPGHNSFQEPWVFLAGEGRKGVQQETLHDSGRYSLNPWFAHVVRIPTRELILEWSKHKKSDDNLDASLDQIVLNVQGHTVRLDMKQTVQIPREVAPQLVLRFGTTKDIGGRATVKQLVEKVLVSTVDGYFRRVSGERTILDFITKYNELCNDLTGEVRQALAPIGVLATTTNLEEFECDDPEINERRKRVSLQEQAVALANARLAELEAEKKNEKVLAEIEMMRVKVEEEREKLKYVKVKVLAEQLGPEYVGVERVLAQYARAQVPQIISGGGGSDSVDALLRVMPAAQILDVLKDWGAQRDGTKTLPRQDAPKPLENGDGEAGA
ncbi:SPFH domain-containing protein [Amycolatopsis sp. NPDC004625]|uniref:SPFH domain-containing protein n=1 Tax=Amycolatopsis sp. NPDC004625 TaxID=3154670 RepID=UPI0033B4F76A